MPPARFIARIRTTGDRLPQTGDSPVITELRAEIL
jgi:hypothetical protein